MPIIYLQALLAGYPACDVIISDDGLQHYRLWRDIEIAVVDGERQFGNGKMLPAGPLREPVERLQSVDLVIHHGGNMQDAYAMNLIPACWVTVGEQTERADLTKFNGQSVHACAGIGNPERFFNALRASGLQVIPHAFPDHYHFKKSDFDFGDHLPVLMTAKDAVKCEAFADERMWYLDVAANLQPAFWRQLEVKLQGVK